MLMYKATLFFAAFLVMIFLSSGVFAISSSAPVCCFGSAFVGNSPPYEFVTVCSFVTTYALCQGGNSAPIPPCQSLPGLIIDNSPLYYTAYHLNSGYFSCLSGCGGTKPTQCYDYGVAGNVCVNLNTDKAHCGRCTTACTGTQQCVNGVCVGGGGTGYCGDGVKQTPNSGGTNEQCDDGNTNSADLCNNCKLTYCGDSIRQQPNANNFKEACDAGLSNGVVCTATYGNSCTYCTSTCGSVTITGPRCGDGTKQSNEACDDGNTNNVDYCSNSCTLPVCGNGVVQGAEACDDANSNNADTCTTSCQKTRCGDGTRNTPSNGYGFNEACDLGSSGNTGTCSAPYGGSCTYCTSTCTSGTKIGPKCGDGAVQTANGEQCDSSNLNGQTCISRGYALGGTLACTSSCTFNTAGCAVCNPNSCSSYSSSSCNTCSSFCDWDSVNNHCCGNNQYWTGSSCKDLFSCSPLYSYQTNNNRCCWNVGGYPQWVSPLSNYISQY